MSARGDGWPDGAGAPPLPRAPSPSERITSSGRRQVGGVSDAHQHHLGGGERPAGGGDFLDALEQHLPGARENAHRQFGGEGAAARALGFGQRNVVGERRNDFDPGDEMGEFGEVAEHHGGIGAGIVLVAHFGQARAADRRASAPRTGR